jgi:hypothetical protein
VTTHPTSAVSLLPLWVIVDCYRLNFTFICKVEITVSEVGIRVTPMVYFFLIKPTDALISQIYFIKKLYMFGTVPLPIIRSFSLYIRHWYMSCRFDNSFHARPGCNCSSILVVRESCHQTCMTYTSAESTVENS